MESLVALLWLGLSVLGLIVSSRAIWRGQRRYRESDDTVGRAVHIAELATGLFFFFVFLLAVCTVVVSLWILPPLDTIEVPASSADERYSLQRRQLLQWLLVGQKAIEVLIVLIPEALDNYLTALARGQHMKNPTNQGTARTQD